MKSANNFWISSRYTNNYIYNIYFMPGILWILYPWHPFFSLTFWWATYTFSGKGTWSIFRIFSNWILKVCVSQRLGPVKTKFRVFLEIYTLFINLTALYCRDSVDWKEWCKITVSGMKSTLRPGPRMFAYLFVYTEKPG